jgi:hypothetical protein
MRVPTPAGGCAFSRLPPWREAVNRELGKEHCPECERLKQSHSSAVNAYGEAVQRLGRARGREAKGVRQDLLKTIEDCERTKRELFAHKGQCRKLDSVSSQ